MNVTSKLISMVCVIGWLGLVAMPMDARSEATIAGQKAVDEIVRAREYFTNLPLINQDGETVRFFDDVLKDKVVVINFIFTNCDGACPLMTHKLSLVRDRMEGQIGDTVQFVSLSIDPERDTPAAMKEFAKTHHADHDGWVFLTGKPENLDYIIKRDQDSAVRSTAGNHGKIAGTHTGQRYLIVGQENLAERSL
jgi:cytochrome oxidase Cu insertion factor (SCO1/SenC/PrrC family)